MRGFGRIRINQTAQRQRESTALAGPDESLGLRRLQLERNGLADERILAILFPGGLIDGQNPDIAQNDFGNDDVTASSGIMIFSLASSESH